MLKAEIIAIGSEMLTPFRSDTNSLYLTRTLEERGIRVVAKTIVGDDQKELVRALEVAFVRSGIIICTGGLGPTVDDLTREAVAEFLQVPLILDPELLQSIEFRFRERNLRMPEANRKQAMIPQGGTALPNHHGSAPGVYIAAREKQLFLLPGPPFEMEPMWERYCVARLPQDEPVYRQIFRIAMMPESRVDELLRPVTSELQETTYTILASVAEIEVHLLAPDRAREEAQHAAEKVRKILGNRIFTEGLERLEDVVGALLRKARRTLSVAESCTGGLLGHRITQVSGSSAYFERGVIVYSNLAKIEMLHVPEDMIARYGAVSAPVAITMAEQIRQISRTGLGVGVTGIAGPEGGTPEKPVGLVYVALADEKVTRVERYNFPGTRERIKFTASQAALNLLRLRLMEP
jgi:nicotinamide-nucleotide amidase